MASASADAHPVVSPDHSPAGATERYVLSIPTEKPEASVRLEVQFPRQLRVHQVGAAPGWRVTPEQDGSGRVLGAIWDGGRSETGSFVDVTVLADNPTSSAELSWPTIQTYEDGSEVQWTGAQQSQFPAAVSRVVNVSSGPDLAPSIAAASLVVSIIALAAAGLALKSTRRYGA